MSDPLHATTGLTWQERGALQTLAHALKACAIPLNALDDEWLTREQREFWTTIALRREENAS